MLPELIDIIAKSREPYDRRDFNSVFFKLVLFSMALSFLASKLAGHLPPWLDQALMPILGLIWAFVFVFIFAAIIRRLRDLHWSPWLALVMMIPLANFILLLFLLLRKGPLTAQPNREDDHAG